LNFDISGTPSWRTKITVTKKRKNNYQQYEEEKIRTKKDLFDITFFLNKLENKDHAHCYYNFYFMKQVPLKIIK